MDFLDFHHHKISQPGIYNRSVDDDDEPTMFSTGLHPAEITDRWEIDFDRVQKNSLSEKCAALGECGLDGRLNIPAEIQDRVFVRHINWANEIRKPIIIHCVRRFQDLLQAVKPAQTPLIVHGFNKNRHVANLLIDNGFYLSFGKALLHHVSLQQIFKTLPVEKIFLETDNHEIDIAELYAKAAEILQTDILTLNDVIKNNFNRIMNG